MPKKLTKNEFIEKAREVHGSKYDYSKVEYVNNKTKVKIICSEHGEFEQQPNPHLLGKGCMICGRISSANKHCKSSSDFIQDCEKIHDNFYDYSKVEYINSITKVEIICPIHGSFWQKPHSHKLGCGCSKCTKGFHTWTLDSWSKSCPGNPGIFYVLRCWNEDEEFYKVGITCQSIESRYSGTKLPYNYEIVKQIVDEDRERIWKLEKEYISLNKDSRYEPLIKFGGSSKECFKIN